MHGERGADPTEPGASGPYPFEAISHEPRIEQLHHDLVRAGHRPFHTPLGMMLDERIPRLAAASAARPATDSPASCTRSRTLKCAASSRRSAIRMSHSSPAPTYRVSRPAPRAARSARCTSRATAHRRSTSASVVVVSCGAINSAALLLRSANERHPTGLANRSDVVGRHYMGHVNSVLMALSREPNPTVFQKTLSLNDFYFGGTGRSAPDGPHLVRRQARRRHALGWGARRSRQASRSSRWRATRSTSG